MLRNVSFLVLVTVCAIVGPRQTVFAGEGCDTTSRPWAWIESDGGDYPYWSADNCNGGPGVSFCDNLCMSNCGTHSFDDGYCDAAFSTGGCGANPACGYWTWYIECECGELLPE
jgi:hypothetical protein